MSIEKRNGHLVIRYRDGKGIGRTITYHPDTHLKFDMGLRELKKLEPYLIIRDKERRKKKEREEEERKSELERSLGYLTDEYLAYCEKPLRKSTWRDKRYRLGLIVKALGGNDISIDEALVPKNICEFITKASIGKDGTPNSASTTNMRINDFLQFLAWLHENDIIDDGTFKKAKTNCVRINDSDSTESRGSDENFWTTEEWDAFILRLEVDDPYRLLFLVTYWGALRIGETLGLKFGDVDYENSTLLIRRSMNQKGEVTKPKNKSSEATIYLRKEVAEQLRAYQMATGSREDDFIFFPWGTPSRVTISKHMEQAAKTAGIKKITLHGLRHSMASRMFNQGINIGRISRHLRHKDISVTLKVYTHLFPNTGKEDIENL